MTQYSEVEILPFLRSLPERIRPPLPLPKVWQAKTFQLSPGWQLSIAFMLNILSLALPIMMLQVYDRIIPRQSFGTMTMLMMGVGIAMLLEVILRSARAWLVGWTAATHEHAAGCAAMERFTQGDINTFEARGASSYMQGMSALSRLREFNSGQVLVALLDLPFAFIFLGLIGYLGGVLAFVPLFILILFGLLAYRSGAQLRGLLETRGQVENSKTEFVVSALAGIHTAKALGMENQMMHNFEKQQKSVTVASYRVALASGLAAVISAGFSQLSLISTAIIGGLMVLNGHLSMGALSACTLLAGRALQPVQRVMGSWLRLQDFDVSRHHAGEIFELATSERKTDELPVPAGQVVFNDVSYAYQGGKPVFEHVSFEVNMGEVIAITGDKGSGKSTLMQLIAGMLSPKHGDIQVDGINPADYGPAALSSHLGYLPQQGAIFKGTLLENMTGFRTEEEVVAMAKYTGQELGLNEVIDQLPKGYNTWLADTHADPIPPGIKQRVALVRVLKNMPTILLFDDADHALDKEGYNRLFRLIGRYKGQHTILMVSHDQNLLSFCDRTYKLANGTFERVDNNTGQNISHLSQPVRKDGA